MKPAPVKVLRPDPETGEAIVEVRPADSFRPKPPRPPKLAEARVSPCSPGWAALHVLDFRERQIVYWEAHASSLTREERSDLANERSMSVLRPLRPSWGVGDKLEVASNLEVQVMEITESFRGYGTVFKLIDHRSWFMKATMGATGTPVVDENGYPVPVSPAERERSRIDGAYTRSASQSLKDGGEVLDDKLHARLHAEAAMKGAITATRNRIRYDKHRMEERLEEARLKHRRSTVRYLERIKAHHEAQSAGNPSD